MSITDISFTYVSFETQNFLSLYLKVFFESDTSKFFFSVSLSYLLIFYTGSYPMARRHSLTYLLDGGGVGVGGFGGVGVGVPSLFFLFEGFVGLWCAIRSVCWVLFRVRRPLRLLFLVCLFPFVRIFIYLHTYNTYI